MQSDRPTLGELQGIADQIGQHLAQAQRITDHACGHIRLHIKHQAQASGIRLWLMGAQQFGQHGLDLEGHRLQIHAPGLDLREVENVVDDAQQRISRGFHKRQVFVLLLRQRRREHQFAQPKNRIHGRADLVTHIGEKLALGAIGGLGIQLGPHQRATAGLPLTHELRQHFRDRCDVVAIAFDGRSARSRHQPEQQSAQRLQRLLPTGKFFT